MYALNGIGELHEAPIQACDLLGSAGNVVFDTAGDGGHMVTHFGNLFAGKCIQEVLLKARYFYIL